MCFLLLRFYLFLRFRRSDFGEYTLGSVCVTAPEIVVILELLKTRFYVIFDESQMQRQVFSDGISVVIVDLDYSNELMTNALFHSYDASLLVAPPALPIDSSSNDLNGGGGGGLVISCKTRRVDALQIPLSTIRDVRRRSAATTETGLPCVEIDFEANASVFHSFFGGGSAGPQHTMTRSLRLVCQIHRDQRQCDIVFGAILGAWRLTQGTSIGSQPDLLQKKVPQQQRSSPLGQQSRLAATVASFLGAKIPSTDLSRWDRVATEDQRLATRHSVGTSHQQLLPGTSPSRRQVDLVHQTDVETDRMLDNCAELESQLRLIQQRRMQRQQLLVSLDCRTSVVEMDEAAASPSSSSSHSIRYFQQQTMQQQQQRTAATKIHMYDPSAIAEGFAAVCPHCGIYSGAEHKDSCPQRTVQCMRCLSNMKLREFPMHASLCVKQAAATNAHHFTLSPDAYLNGTAVPQSAKSQVPDVAAAAPSTPAPATAVVAAAPTASSSPAPSISKTPLLERNISFAEIPRVQSIIVKKEEKVETPVIRAKSLRFVGDDAAGSSSSDRRAAASANALQRRRPTTFADDEPTPAVTTIQCQWCKKYAPPDHPRKCAERRVLCTLCREEVFLRDKKEHRVVCAGAPTRYASDLSPEATTRQRSFSNSREEELDDEEAAYERRIKKLEAYRQRLDVLRRANAENGTPSRGLRAK